MDNKFWEELNARLSATTPGPWRTPEESQDLTGDRLSPYNDEHVVVDHEGCAVWPWHKREDMIFAYKARTDIEILMSEITRQKSILEAAHELLRSVERDPQDSKELLGRIREFLNANYT